MWQKVGLLRSEESLLKALEELDELEERLASVSLETQNMLVVARLVTESARMRRESRGVHYRQDYPETKAEWRRHIFVGETESVKQPVAASG